MIKVESIETWGFEHAIRGMRNPLNSWAKSDSKFEDSVPDYAMDTAVTFPILEIGDNDLQLMRRLFNAGTEHRKYLRQIFISMDITAPLYWWKEFDTYKVGTVANSCSTMHKIAAKEFTMDDFSHEQLFHGRLMVMTEIINQLNYVRYKYLETKDKKWWWQMIQLLPTSYNQKRTVTMNYENAVNMIRQRSHHKLDEWRSFVEVLQQLPNMVQLLSVEIPEGMD